MPWMCSSRVFVTQPRAYGTGKGAAHDSALGDRHDGSPECGLNGEADHIDRVDPKTVALLARVPTINILETTGTQYYTFPCADVEPFGNDCAWP